MKQIERLIARLVQLVEDSPCSRIILTIEIDSKHIPIGWQVTQIFKEEGTLEEKNVI